MPGQTTKTTLREEFMFQNVGYWSTVYITGDGVCWFSIKLHRWLEMQNRPRYINHHSFSLVANESKKKVLNCLTFFFFPSFLTRWFNMTHAEVEQAIGTLCLDLSTWLQDNTWLLKSMKTESETRWEKNYVILGTFKRAKTIEKCLFGLESVHMRNHQIQLILKIEIEFKTFYKKSLNWVDGLSLTTNFQK